jgi:hypothetical protein
MKKQLLLIGKSLMAVMFLTVTATSVSAQVQQTSSESGLTPKIGVKGGVNLTNLYVDEVDDENMKAGLNLGLFAKIPVTRGFSIQPEILYSNKGAKVAYNNTLIGGEYRFNLNYLEVPVLGVVNVAKNFNVHFGGYAAYLTNVNIKAEDNGSSNEELVSFDEDDFNRFDYGLVGGIGFDVKGVTLGARYNYGLNQVGEKSDAFISNTVLRNAKNSGITLYAGFGF